MRIKSIRSLVYEMVVVSAEREVPWVGTDVPKAVYMNPVISLELSFTTYS